VTLRCATAEGKKGENRGQGRQNVTAKASAYLFQVLQRLLIKTCFLKVILRCHDNPIDDLGVYLALCVTVSERAWNQIAMRLPSIQGLSDPELNTYYSRVRHLCQLELVSIYMSRGRRHKRREYPVAGEASTSQLIVAGDLS
jgi:hypothetical protein